MGNEHFDPELDDLLKDLHQLLDDDSRIICKSKRKRTLFNRYAYGFWEDVSYW